MNFVLKIRKIEVKIQSATITDSIVYNFLVFAKNQFIASTNLSGSDIIPSYFQMFSAIISFPEINSEAPLFTCRSLKYHFQHHFLYFCFGRFTHRKT